MLTGEDDLDEAIVRAAGEATAHVAAHACRQLRRHVRDVWRDGWRSGAAAYAGSLGRLAWAESVGYRSPGCISRAAAAAGAIDVLERHFDDARDEPHLVVSAAARHGQVAALEWLLARAPASFRYPQWTFVDATPEARAWARTRVPLVYRYPESVADDPAAPPTFVGATPEARAWARACVAMTGGTPVDRLPRADRWRDDAWVLPADHPERDVGRLLEQLGGRMLAVPIRFPTDAHGRAVIHRRGLVASSAAVGVAVPDGALALTKVAAGPHTTWMLVGGLAMPLTRERVVVVSQIVYQTVEVLVCAGGRPVESDVTALLLMGPVRPDQSYDGVCIVAGGVAVRADELPWSFSNGADRLRADWARQTGVFAAAGAEL